VAYRADDSGVLRPEIPTTCPYAGPGEGCAVKAHHWRPRVTGPRHPLVVARCAVHEVAFTLYPPGHYPYGRVPLMHAAHDGSAVRGATVAGTLFGAALDAARCCPWERSIPAWSDAEPDPALQVPGGWSTQQRRLDLALRILGLGDDLSATTQHAIATALDVDTLVLRDVAKAMRDSPGYRARGQAVEAVLGARPAERRLTWLLVAGHLAGLWGRPWWWRRGALRPVGPFRVSGTHRVRPKIRPASGSTKGGRGPPGCPG
jgi:hypothetical protein